MKVLHVYAGNLFGGVETLLINLAAQQHFCPQMEPHYALCFEGKLSEELQKYTAKVYVLGEVRISRPWKVWRARQQLKKLLLAEKFDIAICHGCWVQVIFGPVIRLAHIPLVFRSPDVPSGKHWLERWAKLIPPDLVIANSYYTLSAIPKIYPTIKSVVVYNPIAPLYVPDPTKVRSKVRIELETPKDAVVIVQACRLEKWKGHKHLISALAQLQDLQNWVCWIAGDAQRPQEIEYLQELKAQAQNTGIAHRIYFLGHRKDIPQLLVAADIHCQPNSSPEPFGNAFVEALYMGLPVVTTPMGGATEIVDESCGKFIDPNNIDDLASALKTLILNSEERRRLGSNGKTKVSQLCNAAQQLEHLHRVLYEIANQNQRCSTVDS